MNAFYPYSFEKDNTNMARKKEEFWRYGPEITEGDVYVFACCEWDGCTLCDSERRRKCDKIRKLTKHDEEIITPAMSEKCQLISGVGQPFVIEKGINISRGNA